MWALDWGPNPNPLKPIETHWKSTLKFIALLVILLLTSAQLVLPSAEHSLDGCCCPHVV